MGRATRAGSAPSPVGGEKQGPRVRVRAAEVAEAATRARWAERGSSTFFPSPVFPSPAQPLRCSCFTVLSRRVAALGFRVAMAGYEYVSPEQLAGFDKYKVAWAGGRPSPSLWPRPGS